MTSFSEILQKIERMRLFSKIINNFLILGQEKIQKDEIINISIGNESCDLDSFVSSMFTSFMTNTIHVVNMKREIFETKGELMWLCKRFEIELENLTFLEIPIEIENLEKRKEKSFFRVKDKKILLKNKVVNMNLTDHNRVVAELEDGDIKTIIDHHQLSKYVSKAETYIIDTRVGSATTLVLDFFRKDFKKLNCKKKSIGMENGNFCSKLADFLLIPIVIDTKNLKKRASFLDKKKYNKLRKISKKNKKDLITIRKEIKKARRIDKKQSTEQILSKDFKKFKFNNIVFGSSTIKYDFHKWINREYSTKDAGSLLFEDLKKFMSKLNLDFYFVTTKLKGRRYVISINSAIFEDISIRKNFSEINYKGMKYYEVPVEFSRKIMVPEIEGEIERRKEF